MLLYFCLSKQVSLLTDDNILDGVLELITISTMNQVTIEKIHPESIRIDQI